VFLEKLRAPSDLGVPLLIFDQFEELVTLFEENPKEREKFEAARTARLAIEKLLCELLLHDALPLKIVFTFRDDYLARLTPLFSRIPNLMDQGVRLAAPQIEVVQRIVRGPFVPSEDGRRGLPGHFRDELSRELAAKIEEGIRERRPSGVLNLSELQTLCLALWQQPPRREELLGATAPGAVLEKIIEGEAMIQLKALARLDRVRALAILSNLVTQEGTRDVVSEENLIQETRRMPVLRVLRGDLKRLLNTLVARTGLLRRSLSSGNTYYELASEFLISWIQKQQQAFRKVAAVSVVGTLLLVAIVMAGFASLFYAQRNAADKARQQAEAAKTAADELITFMQYDLSESLGKVGRLDMMSAINGRIRKYYEDHPPEAGDLDALRERSVALNQQGDILGAQGDLAGALTSYRDSLAIRDKLAKQDPGNAEWQRDLSVSYDRVGDVQRAQGDLAGALTSYRDSLAIRDKLAKQDPGNAQWQGDLGWTYWAISRFLAEADSTSKKEARAMAGKGRDILRQLKTRTGLTAQQQQLLDAIEADLRRTQEETQG
jgi:tetratricopeptide (TPR) repeat protein